MDQLTYVKLLRTSRGLTKRSQEAEDLLQAVLLAAVDAGRADLSCDRNRHWVIGALKKRALFDARSAIRRRQRESSYALTISSAITAPAYRGTLTPSAACHGDFVSTLPQALRTTALLVLTGHNGKEIAWLLRLSDPALRQRIRAIRARWLKSDVRSTTDEWLVSEFPGLKGDLSFGRLRRSMLKAVDRRAGAFASHDPDGHVFIVCSQNTGPRQLPDMPHTNEELKDA